MIYAYNMFLHIYFYYNSTWYNIINYYFNCYNYSEIFLQINLQHEVGE